MEDNETFEDKVQRHADEDFTNKKEPQVLKVGINVSIEVEGVEMVNEVVEFETQDEASNADWNTIISGFVGSSIKNWNRPELE